MEALFNLGEIKVEDEARKLLSADDLGQAVAKLLARHHQGDWGDVSAEQSERNAAAVHHADEIVSRYEVADIPVWVYTTERHTQTIITTKPLT